MQRFTHYFEFNLLGFFCCVTDEECQTIINLASREGLDTSEVQDPETGINIEPTNEKTFHSWDYNSDGVIDKVEVRMSYELRIKDKTRLW